MFHYLKKRLARFYYKRCRKMSDMEIDIMYMRRSGIKIGESCRLFTRISSNEPWLISIGSHVTMSSGVQLVTHDNGIIKVLPGKTDVVGPITIGDSCFLGMNCMLLPGVTLGENCIVGAGSVVTKSFPPHTVLAGNPARAICSTDAYAAKYREQAIDFSSIPFAERKNYLNAHPELLIRR